MTTQAEDVLTKLDSIKEQIEILETNGEYLSSCCQARRYEESDICIHCGEHAEFINTNQEDIDELTLELKDASVICDYCNGEGEVPDDSRRLISIDPPVKTCRHCQGVGIE